MIYRMSKQDFATCFPSLAAESPLSGRMAGSLQALFKVLANGVRLRILHAVLRADELCVSDICREVGMKPAAVSNHLQRLHDQGVVSARREGQHVYYRVVDPCVGGLMDVAVCLLKERQPGRARSGPRA